MSKVKGNRGIKSAVGGKGLEEWGDSGTWRGWIVEDSGSRQVKTAGESSRKGEDRKTRGFGDTDVVLGQKKRGSGLKSSGSKGPDITVPILIYVQYVIHV